MINEFFWVYKGNSWPSKRKNFSLKSWITDCSVVLVYMVWVGNDYDSASISSQQVLGCHSALIKCFLQHSRSGGGFWGGRFSSFRQHSSTLGWKYSFVPLFKQNLADDDRRPPSRISVSADSILHRNLQHDHTFRLPTHVNLCPLSNPQHSIKQSILFNTPYSLQIQISHSHSRTLQFNPISPPHS